VPKKCAAEIKLGHVAVKMLFAKCLSVGSALKIRRQAIHFPIAIAGRIEPAAAAGFLRLIGVAVTLGAACCSFGERAFGGWRQRALIALLALRFGRVLRLGWHRL